MTNARNRLKYSRKKPAPHGRSRVYKLLSATAVFALFFVLCISPAAALDAHEHDEGDHGLTGEWTPINSLSDLLSISTGNYYLNTDIDLTNTWSISGNKIINLCLNGHVIKQTVENKGVIDIASGSTLTLYDCGNGKHYFDKDGETGLWVWNDASTESPCNVTGGVITGGSLQTGSGVYNKGTFNMNGGNIVGNTAKWGGGVRNDNKFTMTGGNIVGNTATSQGGGVLNQGTGTFTMTGGSITSNTATNSNGGGVYNDGAEFTMTNGVISDNSAKFGSGVFVNSDKTFTMSGGSIEDNTATSQGGGVFNKGAFTMSGGSISGNEVTGGSNSGGGVHNQGGEFTMTDGIISGNEAQYGGGVYNKDDTSGGLTKKGTFTMSGSSEISGNTAGNYGGGVHNEGTFNMNAGSITGNTAANLGGGVYIFKNAFTMVDGTIGSNIAVSGGGVYNNQGTFNMNAGSITDNTANNGNGGGVHNFNTGVFTMNGGSITNNKVTGSGDSGGGVHNNKGEFIMNLGSISGNTAKYGGGVYNYEGTFTMKDGSITDNTATVTCGGGVYNIEGGTFNMEGGNIMSNNAQWGGGVMNTASTFTMSGGSISGNKATSQGGGVLNKGTFNMEGGSITGNDANTYEYANGGGVFTEDGAITISGNAQIYGNTINSVDANNVYLKTGKLITIGTGGLTTGAYIGVTTQTAPTAGNPVDVTVEGVDESNTQYFVADKPNEQHPEFVDEVGKIVLAVGGGDVPPTPPGPTPTVTPTVTPTLPGNGDLNVTYDKKQTYVVVIPGDMDFGGEISIQNDARVTEMWLEIDSKLTLKVKSTNGFEMVQGEHDVSFIPYTMKVNGEECTNKEGFNVVLSVPAGKPKEEGKDYHAMRELNYVVKPEAVAAARFAGEHKDTLTFEVSVE